MTDITECT